MKSGYCFFGNKDLNLPCEENRIGNHPSLLASQQWLQQFWDEFQYRVIMESLHEDRRWELKFMHNLSSDLCEFGMYLLNRFLQFFVMLICIIGILSFSLRGIATLSNFWDQSCRILGPNFEPEFLLSQFCLAYVCTRLFQVLLWMLSRKTRFNFKDGVNIKIQANLRCWTILNELFFEPSLILIKGASPQFWCSFLPEG